MDANPLFLGLHVGWRYAWRIRGAGITLGELPTRFIRDMPSPICCVARRHQIGIRKSRPRLLWHWNLELLPGHTVSIADAGLEDPPPMPRLTSDQRRLIMNHHAAQTHVNLPGRTVCLCRSISRRYRPSASPLPGQR